MADPSDIGFDWYFGDPGRAQPDWRDGDPDDDIDDDADPAPVSSRILEEILGFDPTPGEEGGKGLPAEVVDRWRDEYAEKVDELTPEPPEPPEPPAKKSWEPGARRWRY